MIVRHRSYLGGVVVCVQELLTASRQGRCTIISLVHYCWGIWNNIEEDFSRICAFCFEELQVAMCIPLFSVGDCFHFQSYVGWLCDHICLLLLASLKLVFGYCLYEGWADLLMILCFLILHFTLHCDHSIDVWELNFSGAFLTAGVLTAGLISFKKGNSELGQKLMRARVVVQGATVALMVGTAYYYGENPWIKS